MKTTLKKMLGLTALGMTLLSNTIPTWAGKVSSQEVYITSGTGYRSTGGSMERARYSADPKQSIGCGIYTYGVNLYVVCRAQTATNFLQCGSSDAKIIAAVQSMTDSSYLRFQVKTGESTCDNVLIANDSREIK